MKGTDAEAEALLAIAAICGGGEHVEVVREDPDWILVEVLAPNGSHLLRVDKDGRVRRAFGQERTVDPADVVERLVDPALKDLRPE